VYKDLQGKRIVRKADAMKNESNAFRGMTYATLKSTVRAPVLSLRRARINVSTSMDPADYGSRFWIGWLWHADSQP
jgi:hypothetical protein